LPYYIFILVLLLRVYIIYFGHFVFEMPDQVWHDIMSESNVVVY